MPFVSSLTGRLWERSEGSVTLVTTFAFVGLFRLEQNVAYVLGLPSPRRLVEMDLVPAELIVHMLAPFLHATPDHLVGALFWIIPFGYVLERWTSWIAYIGFVVVAGYVTTTFVPLVLVAGGIPVSPGIGASGIANVLVAREGTVRGIWVLQRQPLARVQIVTAVVSLLVMLLKTLRDTQRVASRDERRRTRKWSRVGCFPRCRR